MEREAGNAPQQPALPHAYNYKNSNQSSGSGSDLMVCDYDFAKF